MSHDWIFLRGLARESAHWGHFSDDFSATFPDACLYPLDLPGSGKYFAGRSPCSVPAMMEFVRKDYLSQRKGQGPVNLFAQSLGAMVSLAWIAKYPQEIGRMVLINPSVSGLSPLSRRLQREGLDVARNVMKAKSAREKEKAILDWVSNDEKAREALVGVWGKLREERPFSTSNLIRQLVAGARFRLGSPPLKAPILILSGGEDRVVHPSCSRALQNYLGCALGTHPTAGHDLTIDAPEWVLQKVGHWMTDSAMP